MNCHATTTSPIPRSHINALCNPHWYKAMVDEYNALIYNETWVLVPRPTNVNVVRLMWLFRHKYNADGSLSRYKARLVTNGLSFSVFIVWAKTSSSGLVSAGSDIAYLLLYVDDIVLTVSSTALLQCIITLLHSEFAMTDLGSLNYFLGISAQRSKSGLFLSQSKFAAEILEWAHMQHCNPCKTPVDIKSKLGSDGDPIYLYMHDPRDPHFHALKRILRYVCGIIDHGLQLHVSSTSQLSAFTDVDWVTLSRSSAEAEYRGVANVVVEAAWIRNLLLELHAPLTTATLAYYDNVSAVYLSTNPVQHQRTKHIKIDIHFVRDYVASGQVRVLHVPSCFQYADIFTKGLLSALFLEFRSSLNVQMPSVPTAGEY
ncbi:ribonuclease H-like domain-containing protein [Tanacetum coccineum]